VVWPERTAKAGEGEHHADTDQANDAAQASMRGTSTRQTRKTGNGDGRGDDHGESDQDNATRDRQPTNGSKGGSPKESAEKITEISIEFAEEEELTTWLQRLDKAATGTAAKYPMAVKLPVTGKQKSSLRQQVEGDLDSYEPACLEDC
jgi:hypothetical protein